MTLLQHPRDTANIPVHRFAQQLYWTLYCCYHAQSQLLQKRLWAT